VQSFITSPKPNSLFLSDLSDFLTQLCAISPSVLLGDFNFGIDDTNCKTFTEFLDLLHCFNFTQHINFPTYTCSSGLTEQVSISDDLAVTTDMDIPIPFPKEKQQAKQPSETSNPSPPLLSRPLLPPKCPPPLPCHLTSPSDLVTYYKHALSSCLD